MNRQWIEAAQNGRVEEVEALLRDHPDLDVNWAFGNQWTALHWASASCHTEVVKLLLAHPAINVNPLNQYGSTPFLFGCANLQVSVAQLLSKDPRVDVKWSDYNGCTSLWLASCYGSQEVVEWLIAAGLDLGDLGKKGKYLGDDLKYTAIEIAKKRNRPEVVV